MSGRRTAPTEKSRGSFYLRKASNFLRAAESSLQGRNFDAAGLAGVHAVISAGDALTVFRLGLRSSGQDHSEVLKLLLDVGIPDATLTQIRETISQKNRAAYEARGITEEEAKQIVTRARRVLEVASRIVPS